MSREDRKKRFREGIEEFLSHYPPFLRHLVFPGTCALIMMVCILIMAGVGSCINCAGTLVYMGKHLNPGETECSLETTSASGFLGGAGELCCWDITNEADCLEVRFECEEITGDFMVVVLTGDGGMVVDGFDPERDDHLFLMGPGTFTVVIYSMDGFGRWSAEWD